MFGTRFSMAMEKDKRLHIRISSQEAEILAHYCEKTQRSQSDVLREMIRALENKNKKLP